MYVWLPIGFSVKISSLIDAIIQLLHIKKINNKWERKMLFCKNLNETSLRN